MKKIVLFFLLFSTLKTFSFNQEIHENIKKIVRKHLYTNLNCIKKIIDPKTQNEEFFKVFSALTKEICKYNYDIVIYRKHVFQIMIQEIKKIIQELKYEIKILKQETKNLNF